MKRLLTLLVILAGVRPALAQTTPAAADTGRVRYWGTSMKVGLNANESLLSDNWKGGGATTVGVSALFNGKAT